MNRAGTQAVVSNTNDAFPLNNRSSIEALAEDYWSEIADRDKRTEFGFENDFQEARSLGYLPKELFVRVARWKSVRNTQRYESNSEDEIRTATAAAFQASDDESAISALRKLNGVALRTASAILHWMRPERFPILDYRVIAALDEKAPKSYEDVTYYTLIADRVRELARKHSLDLRTIDRALWIWDKLRSKPGRTSCRMTRT
jgi:hypothetical protein